MNKEEVAMLGFEIVAYAGEARSYLLQALNQAKNNDFNGIDMLIEKANQCINEAHVVQTDMLAKEASGEIIDLGFIMLHGQDHLMTTMLLKDVIEHLINIYR
ncbi:PTS lactose/cellobiose transporter subunit IIA [Aerococcaceae bacterium zg-BR9]|uniref:PTS lactose/cellobiose transporter subunit IIA n=1 Tax=Aerococcaceae bacterium zg-1292 TaxID=2774330 RepID=UPI0040630A33|nr:PTS lactose/cellobiose transporter subunit IIA [Aerococcaceae bacterium zg-BR9]